MDCSCGNRNNYAMHRMNNANNCGCSENRNNSCSANRSNECGCSMNRRNDSGCSMNRRNDSGCSMNKDHMCDHSMDYNGCGCDMMNNNMKNMVLGMAYVPMQKWNKIFDPDKGWNEGTIFPELVYPFYGCIPNGYAGGNQWKGGRCV